MVDNNDPIILEHSIFLTVDNLDRDVCSAAGKDNVTEMKFTQFK